MSLIREAANNLKVPEMTQDLRGGLAQLVDTYGETLPYGHDLPKGIRGTARFFRTLMLKLTPNPDNLSLEARMDRKVLRHTVEKNGVPVEIKATAAYDTAKDSPWIDLGVSGADDGEYVTLQKQGSARIQYPDSPIGSWAKEAEYYDLQKYQDVMKKLQVDLQQNT